jgi:hypothetical protein
LGVIKCNIKRAQKNPNISVGVGGVGRAPIFQNIIVIFNYQSDFQIGTY